MAKSYRINFIVDDSQARAAAQRSIKGMESTEAAARRAAATQEREARRLDAIQDRLVRADYSRKVQHERMKVAAADRAAKQATAAQEGAARKLDAIQDRFVRRDYSRRVQFEKEKIAKTERMVIAGATALAGAALVGLQALNAGYAQIREDALAAAEATLKLKANLRVEGTLKGVGGNEALREAIAFRAQTALGEKEATEFTKQYLGTVPIARQKGNITPEVEKELMVQAGIMAARQGGDAGTKGELAGILGQFGPVNTAQEGLNQLEAIRIALTEGRGDDTPLTQQLLKAAGSIVREGGVVASLPEMAALVGVTSLAAGPEEAGTRAQQLVRGLRVGLTKQTTAEGTEVSQGDYLKSLGISEQDDLERTLALVVPDLRRAKDTGRDLDVYLAGKNFRSFEERRALIEVVENYGAFVQRMEASRKAGQGAGALEANKKFLRGAEGQNAMAQVAIDAAQITRGVGNERALAALKLAEASPDVQAADQTLGGKLGDFAQGFFSGNFMNPMEAGRKVRVEDAAVEDLRKRALAAGVPDEEIRRAGFDSFVAGGGQRDIGYFTNQVQGLIEARGGEVAADLKPTLERMNVTLDRLDATLGAPPKAPRALPGAPVGGPVRP